MSEAETNGGQAASQVYYTTAYALRTGTTSTLALQIWRALSSHLTNHGMPMTGAELSESIGISVEEIEHIFSIEYYKRSYGFLRFASLQEWQDWTESSGVFYTALPPEEAEPDEEAETREPASEAESL